MFIPGSYQISLIKTFFLISEGLYYFKPNEALILRLKSMRKTWFLIKSTINCIIAFILQPCY